MPIIRRLLRSVTCFVVSLCIVTVSDAAVVTTVNHATRDEHIVWRRAPINITLPVGHERLISFPERMQFGYDVKALPASALRVQNDNHTLYLLAKHPFTTHRVQAKLATGDIILLDINAQSHADNNPLDIVLPQLPDNPMQPTPVATIAYVTLMRYAIQHLYAPERLVTQHSGMTRFPMETAHVVPLFYDGSVTAMPLASWRGGDAYVTAILVKNRLAQALRLNPSLLCGAWQAVSFYPNTVLAPRGTALNDDTSTLFVISSRPFSRAIHLCAL